MKRAHITGTLVLAAVGVLLLPSMLGAQGAGAGVSQFNVGSPGDRYIEVFNPGEHEMFVLGIRYNHDGSLNTDDLDHDGVCRAVVVPPHGTGDQGLNWDPFDPSSEERGDRGGEFIAIPTSGQFQGQFDESGDLGLGVFIHMGRGANAAPLPASVFNPPAESGDQELLANCACCELLELSLPANLLSQLGINCDTAEGLTCDALAAAPAAP